MQICYDNFALVHHSQVSADLIVLGTGLISVSAAESLKDTNLRIPPS